MRLALLSTDWWQRSHLTPLANELIRLGHAAQIHHTRLPPPDLAGADIVISINSPRNDAIPAAARHIAWIQDYAHGHPDYSAAARPDDLIYTFGHGPRIGVPCESWPQYRGSLLVGVDPALLAHPVVPKELDLFLPGQLSTLGIDPRLNLPPEFTSFLLNTLHNTHKPLTGTLNQTAAVAYVKTTIETRYPNIWNLLDIDQLGSVIHEAARANDRTAIADLMLATSEKTVFVGSNWGKNPK